MGIRLHTQVFLGPLLIFSVIASSALGWSPEPNAGDGNKDGVSNLAPSLKYYASFCENLLGGDSDPHAVHGIELRSGGYAVVGKYNTGSFPGGFVVVRAAKPPGSYGDGDHVTVNPSTVWKSTFGNTGLKFDEAAANGANMVVELGAHLYVAGFMARSNVQVDAALLKYETATGKLIWTYKYKSSKTSAFEGIQKSADGKGIVLSGLKDANNGSCLEGFKSYGNPACGTATIMYFAEGKLGNEVPDSPTWIQTYNGYVSGKNLKVVNDGYATVASNNDESASVIVTDLQGAKKWSKTYGDQFGEVTDLVFFDISGQIPFLMISGHGGNNGEIYGRLGKISMSGSNEGNLLWAKSYGGVVGGKAQFKGITDPNPSKWVYHECWGIAPSADGKNVVLGCGAGIEGCDGRPNACKKDKRVVWRSYIFSASISDGTVLWQRLDSFDDINANNVADSASEFIVPTSDGGFLSTNDENCGVGILRLEPPDQAPAPVPVPVPSPVLVPSPVTVPTPAVGEFIVHLGDSFSSFSGYSLETFCAGKNVVNQGIGGTDTSDWDNGLITEKLDEVKNDPYTHVLLAIGGNDYLNSGCTISKNKLTQNIDKVIKRVINIAKKGTSIVMIGYCAPTTEFDECDTFDVATLSDAIEAAVALNAASATYVDSTGACGGSPSKAAYMVDAIHANNRGYCTLYTTLDAQEALACSPIKTEVDCKKVSKNVPKKPTPVAPSAPAPIPAPVPNSTPAPVPAPAPVPQPECEDNDKMKFNLKGGKKRKCSQLKKSECSKWDKKKRIFGIKLLPEAL